MTYFPHIVCLRGDALLLWSSVVTDVLIALAYYAIPFVFMRLRLAGHLSLDSALTPIWTALQWFILSCGTGHLVDAANVWLAWYWLKVTVNVLTVASSSVAVVIFVRHGQRVGRLLITRRQLADKIESLHEKLNVNLLLPGELI